MTHPQPRPSSKRERTRAQLIDAALSVLSVRGLEATSIDDLMEVAGMSRGTFYNYFQTRDEVLIAASRHIEDQVLKQVIGQLPDDVDDDSRIACAIHGLLGFFLANPRLGWVQIRLAGGLRWLDPAAPRDPRFASLDRALAAVVGETTSSLATLVYLEGCVLMLLRRLLEQRMNRQEAETTLTMTLRGLGIAPARLPVLMQQGRSFADSMPTTHSGTVPPRAATVLQEQLDSQGRSGG